MSAERLPQISRQDKSRNRLQSRSTETIRSFLKPFGQYVQSELKQFPEYFDQSSQEPYLIRTSAGARIEEQQLRDLYFSDSYRDIDMLRSLLQTPWLLSRLDSKTRATLFRKIEQVKQIESGDYNQFMYLDLSFEEKKLKWKSQDHDCEAMHEAFKTLDLDQEQTEVDAAFKKVSIYRALHNSAIPRNPVHLRVNPGEHTQEVEALGLLDGLDHRLQTCAKIAFKIHDWGKIVTALNDERQHHPIISAEFFHTYARWVTREKPNEIPWFVKEPYLTIIKTVVRLHDVLGLMGKGVFKESDFIDLIVKETSDLKNGDLTPFRNSRDEFYASISAILGALSSADARSVAGYEHFGIYNSWEFIRMFEENHDISVKRKFAPLILQHANLVLENMEQVKKARLVLIDRLSKTDPGSYQYNNIADFILHADLDYMKTYLTGIKAYYENHLDKRAEFDSTIQIPPDTTISPTTAIAAG